MAIKFIRNTPHLPVKDLKQTLVYYRGILGFTNEWVMGKDGGISRDDMHLLFSEHNEFVQIINIEQQRLPLVWFVDDIKAVYKEFKEKGIHLADDLRKHPYGLWEFAFIDINGYYIRVAEERESEESIATRDENGVMTGND